MDIKLWNNIYIFISYFKLVDVEQENKQKMIDFLILFKGVLSVKIKTTKRGKKNLFTGFGGTL